MNLSAIHNYMAKVFNFTPVVCDIGGYEFVSYSQLLPLLCLEAVQLFVI